MDDAPPLPFQRFRTEGLDADAAFDAWQQTIAPVFDVDPCDLESGFSAGIDGFLLGPMMLSVCRFGATHFMRSPTRIARDGLDHLMIQLYLDGGYVGEHAGAPVQVSAGPLSLLDMARALDTRTPAAANITLIVPRDLVGGSAPGALHPRADGADIAGLLALHLRNLPRILPHLQPKAAAGVAESTAALVRAALLPSTDARAAASTAVAQTRILSARRLIDARIGDPSLDADSLAAALGLSRSTLYRLFDPHGGVAAFILERRLLRARALLRNRDDRRRIGEIGHACGFADPSHFARAFRRRFGMSPLEARAAGGAAMGAAGPDARSDFAEWINGLG